MRTVLAATLLTVCGLAARGDEVPAHASKEGRFSAKFPTQPGTVVATKTVKVAGTELSLTSSDKGFASFSVAFCDLGPEALKDAPAAKVLEKSEQGLVAQMRMTVTGAKAITFGEKKYPAREFTAERDGAHLRVLLVLAETRLYQVFVNAPKEALTGKEVEEFFASFVIN